MPIDSRSATAPAIALVLKGYPRLSESFIAQEIRALERRGLDLRIYSLRHPTDPSAHPVHREIEAPVCYLPEYLYQEPWPVLHAWLRVRRLPGYRTARRLWLQDLRRDVTPNRVRRFGQACILAAEMPAEIGHIHAHFLHTPASVARYAAQITGRTWSCSAHAKDIWTTPEWEKREKIADADWIVTCTASGRDHLGSLAASSEKVALAYHGLDFDRFPAPPAGTSDARGKDGSEPARPVVIFSVGRAVEKKGYGCLLDALARLPEGLSWRFVHIGGGELRPALESKAEALGLADRIEWLGPQSQETVLAQYRSADLFVLASRIASDGDRDGLPNVLMEAQSQGLACVSTRVSAIPELIEADVTGVLVSPDDPDALALALESLIRDPALRDRLGAAGARRVRQDFAMDAGIDRVATLLGAPAVAHAAQ